MQSRLSLCSRLALIHLSLLVWSWAKQSFSGRGHEEHSGNSEKKQRHIEGRGEKPHSRLFKLSRRASEEEHGGKEHRIGEIFTGLIARFARFGEPPHGLSPC